MKGNTKFKSNLCNMLFAEAKAKESKALITLQLMCEHPVGIGDHSTDDFYNNAIDAIRNLADASDELKTIDNFFLKKIYD